MQNLKGGLGISKRTLLKCILKINRVWGCGLSLSSSGYGLVMGCYEHSNKPMKKAAEWLIASQRSVLHDKVYSLQLIIVAL
jgi:hypothetical protein